jgi:acyl-CoA synthetase (AMP-forming)/AMP-acid ligase II
VRKYSAEQYVDKRSRGIALVFRSPFADLTVPELSLTQAILDRAACLGSKPAIIDGASGATLTYADLGSMIRSLAAGLVDDGLAKGDVVAIAAANSPEFAIVFHAVLLAGGVVTTVNPAYSVRELRHQLVDSGAVRIVTTTNLLDTVSRAAAATSVAKILVLDDHRHDSAIWDLAVGSIAAEIDFRPDDLAVLPYSSGTTGVSKGVMLSHTNISMNVAQSLVPLCLDADDVISAVLPLFHIYGMQIVMNCGLKAGATIVTLPRFELIKYLSIHEQYAVTRSFVAPPIVLLLAKEPVVEDYDLSRLKQVFSGAAPLPHEAAALVAQRLGCEVVQGYGMTETSPATLLSALGRGRDGTVGQLLPNTEMLIVDSATQEAVGAAEPGEIWIRGPQVMLGYLHNAAATAEVLDEHGWLHTGDIGIVDGEGYLYVVDRAKELIKVKGFQVAPAELETLLLAHPLIADAAVVGRPDDASGERPVAFVVTRGIVATEDILAHVAVQVATYKRLAEVHFVEAIPKSPSGKILRRELRAKLVLAGACTADGEVRIHAAAASATDESK